MLLANNFRQSLFILLSILAFGCRNSEKLASDNSNTSKDSTSNTQTEERTKPEVDFAESKRKIENNRNNIVNVTADFNEFKIFAQRLDKYDFYTISTTADYLKEFLPKAEEAYQDSAYLHFLYIFYRVANNQTDSLYLKFPQTMEKLEQNESDSETAAFELFLKSFGIGLFMTEGTFYLDVKPDYFVSIFNGKVSKGLDAYLNLRAQELKEGFSEDAGLLVSFEQLYERVQKWETFINEYPNSIMIDDAKSYFETYLETLLTGMDNSRVFDDSENPKLLPEIKSLYEAIIGSNANRKSTEIIKGYYIILTQNDFRYSAELDSYLKEHGFSSMMGIQPHTR